MARQTTLLSRIAVTATVLVLLATGCGGSTNEPPSVSTGTAVGAASPTSGDPSVDKVLDALLAGHPAAITVLFAPTPTRCTDHAKGLGDPPPCPVGVPDGSLIDVFRATACDAVFPDALATAVDGWIVHRHALYAIYRDPGEAANGWIPAADYAIVLNDPDSGAPGGRGSAFHVTGGKVVGARFGCGTSLDGLVAGVEPGRFVVPPPP